MNKQKYKLYKKEINAEIREIRFSLENLMNYGVTGVLAIVGGSLITSGAVAQINGLEDTGLIYLFGGLASLASATIAKKNVFVKEEDKLANQAEILKLQKEKLELLKQYKPESKLVGISEKFIKNKDNKNKKKNIQAKHKLYRRNINNQIASIRFNPARYVYYMYAVLTFFVGMTVATVGSLWDADERTMTILRGFGAAIGLAIPTIFLIAARLSKEEKARIKELRGKKKELLTKRKEELHNLKCEYNNVYNIVDGQLLTRK